MKDIKSLLNKIDAEEKVIVKIAKFLKTKRGQTFVSKLYTASLRELCYRFEAPKFILFYNNDRKNMNLILAAMKKYNITTPKVNRIIVEAPKRVKFQIYLTKEEIRKIDSHRPRKKLGNVERLIKLEEAKMAKYIKLNPAPTESELAQDLFPKELKEAYENKLECYREHVRDFITSAYFKIPVFGRFKIAEGKYVERVITEIKDINGGAHHINDISIEHPLLKKVQQIVDEYYKKDNTLICIIVKGHNRKFGRMLIPHKQT